MSGRGRRAGRPDSSRGWLNLPHADECEREWMRQFAPCFNGGCEARRRCGALRFPKIGRLRRECVQRLENRAMRWHASPTALRRARAVPRCAWRRRPNAALRTFTGEAAVNDRGYSQGADAVAAIGERGRKKAAAAEPRRRPRTYRRSSFIKCGSAASAAPGGILSGAIGSGRLRGLMSGVGRASAGGPRHGEGSSRPPTR